MRRIRASLSLILGVTSLTLVSCGSQRGMDEFKPIVAKTDQGIQAITAEEAKEICKTNYCETNTIFTTYFGRRRSVEPSSEDAPNPPPAEVKPPWDGAPGPLTNPASQMAQQLDYSRTTLNMQDAWTITKGDPSVTVAVVDSGIMNDHPDLKDSMAVNQAELNGKPGVDDDGNGYIDDVYGWDFYRNAPDGWGEGDAGMHGTHVAGIIAAADNDIGVVGIAPKVKLISAKFIGPNGFGDTASAIAAIHYAVIRGAKVLNNSWGSLSSSKTPQGDSRLLQDEITAAIQSGAIFVAAAGNTSPPTPANNNDNQAVFPANMTNVISVANTTVSDVLHYSSNYGPSTVMIAAPGTDILSTYRRDEYARLTGTSMASPQVTGAIALGLSIRPNATLDQIKSALCSSAKKILTTQVHCGRMDVNAFLRAL